MKSVHLCSGMEQSKWHDSNYTIIYLSKSLGIYTEWFIFLSSAYKDLEKIVIMLYNKNKCI